MTRIVAPRRRTLVTLAASALLAGLSALAFVAAADAATVTVTGDDGNPVPLAQSAPGAIRNMSPSVGISFPADAKGHYSVTYAGPDGTAVASPISCYTLFSTNRSLDYRGNGSYTVTVTSYADADRDCATATGTETYTFAIGAGVALSQPTVPFLTRAPNSYSANTLNLPVALNPGTSSYELNYAAGGVVGPDGAISGASQPGYVNTTTGSAPLTFKTPGVYTVVARAKGTSGGGAFFTPWSVPVKILAVAPFDLSGNLVLTDSRGPSYAFRGTVRELAAAGGRVNIAMGKGKKGKYKSLGSVKITSKGTFSKRFTQKTAGTYRLRLKYKGNGLVAGGTIVQQFRVTKRVVFG